MICIWWLLLSRFLYIFGRQDRFFQREQLENCVRVYGSECRCTRLCESLEEGGLEYLEKVGRRSWRSMEVGLEGGNGVVKFIEFLQSWVFLDFGEFIYSKFFFEFLYFSFLSFLFGIRFFILFCVRGIFRVGFWELDWYVDGKVDEYRFLLSLVEFRQAFYRLWGELEFFWVV